ncbi:carbohydrate-binding protein [Pseudomonas sp. 91RF]|uniref:carbohydrate-binding module family 20 domain-containing protein n=1 Tax=Pseudomonas sp. 91RF TaxID=2292261 RepID=UPI000E674882|nr:carbohydrate-binding module family 20 domain-containing protein [Pseudomonas sp. 91RF]RIJ11424.1 carbohydrate-binding protein [Pseudomonas sp. 91RF]
MFRIRHPVPKGVLLLAMLSLIGNAQSTVTFTYFLPVDFQCNNGVTTPGYSVYVVGARPELGAWDVTKAVKLAPSAYPAWTGSIKFTGANPGDVVEWKCIIRNETNPNDVQKWQAGANNQVTLAFKPTPTSVGTL